MYDKKKKTSNVRSVHLLDRKRNIHYEIRALDERCVRHL